MRRRLARAARALADAFDRRRLVMLELKAASALSWSRSSSRQELLGTCLVDIVRCSSPCRWRCSRRDAAVAEQRMGVYPNFAEDPAAVSGFFDLHTWERLRRVKALYDPQDLVKASHHIAPS